MNIETPAVRTEDEFLDLKAACDDGELVQGLDGVEDHYLLQDGRRIAKTVYDHVAPQVPHIIMTRTPITRTNCETWQEAAQIVDQCPESEVYEIWSGEDFYYTADGVKYDADDIRELRKWVDKERMKEELREEFAVRAGAANQQKAKEWQRLMTLFYWKAVADGMDHNEAQEAAFDQYRALAEANDDLRSITRPTANKFMTEANMSAHKPKGKPK
ncbi:MULTISPECIES: hypothetical protein [unclassified Ruegeria]|uniref:hypothetical protein n=1 Tax=unclassified Ruegeria TaxID=2625375 RepID=UPI00147D43AC|nr:MULTISPECIES: hypothetical protein [unclassified Ruegeria]